MEVLARVTISGVKYWVGNLDGKDVDSATIFVDKRLRGETAKGTCSKELKVEKSAIIKSIWHLPLPFEAEVTMEQTTNGKSGGDREIVTSIKPLGVETKSAKQTASAAA
ncbi:hypothetical protein [Burkholderia cenocepacia]|uniref:hypothetical protein n=1 Tax=Burkholderia cenocepacia TaxID=95486 RepID=UPI002AB08758|nr:hypothetical protein [Burkholderia cenocepacia]